MGSRPGQPSDAENAFAAALDEEIAEKRRQVDEIEDLLDQREKEVKELRQQLAEQRRQLEEQEAFAERVKAKVRSQAADGTKARLPAPQLTVLNGEGGSSSDDDEDESDTTVASGPSAQLSEVKEAILEVFRRDSLQEWTPKAMYEELNSDKADQDRSKQGRSESAEDDDEIAYGTVRTTMGRMAEAGQLEKGGYGRYHLPEQPRRRTARRS